MWGILCPTLFIFKLVKDLTSIAILFVLIPEVCLAQNDVELLHIEKHTELIGNYLPKRIDTEDAYLVNYFNSINQFKEHSVSNESAAIITSKDQEIKQLIANRRELSINKNLKTDIAKSIPNRINIEDVYIRNYFDSHSVKTNTNGNVDITDFNTKKDSEIEILLNKREQNLVVENASINNEIEEFLVETNKSIFKPKNIYSKQIESNPTTTIGTVNKNNSLSSNESIKNEYITKNNDTKTQKNDLAESKIEKTEATPTKKEVVDNVKSQEQILAVVIEPKKVIKKEESTKEVIQNNTVEEKLITPKEEDPLPIETKEVAKENKKAITLSEADKLEIERNRLLKLYRTKFDKTTFLVQVISLKEDIPERQVANNLGIKERLVKYTVNGSIKYFISGFNTYDKAREKVNTLKMDEIDSFILVKQANEFILPSLFFKLK